MSDSSQAQGKPVLSLKHVGVRYARKAGFLKHDYYWALKDVTFDLYHGETLGVIGNNGAGKSTLMRLLAGIIKPDRGEIAGEDVDALLLSLQVGFSQHLSGRENAIMSGILLGMPRREVEAGMNEIAEFAELGEFLDEPVRTYSSGMKARLGFAVAFKADPDILLIDEVLGVGDIEFKKKSSAAMREKIRSNKTVVLVSHSMGTLRNLCDRVVWLEKGETVAVGPAREVVAQYLDKYGEKLRKRRPGKGRRRRRKQVAKDGNKL